MTGLLNGTTILPSIYICDDESGKKRKCGSQQEGEFGKRRRNQNATHFRAFRISF
jgi:hypothetical protein